MGLGSFFEKLFGKKEEDPASSAQAGAVVGQTPNTPGATATTPTEPAAPQPATPAAPTN